MSKKFNSNIMTAIYIIFIFHFLMDPEPSGCMCDFNKMQQ